MQNADPSVWDIVRKSIDSGTAYFILFLLTLNTMRDILAWIGIFPRGKKYSWAIYNRYEEETIRNTLQKLGFHKGQIRQIASQAIHQEIEKISSPITKVVWLIWRYTAKFEHEITYGTRHPVNSYFYINTMEASQNDEDLRLMYELIHRLILNSLQNYSREKPVQFPDFIITPKNGNPILGRKFAETYRLPSILRKSSSDSSRAKQDVAEYKNNLIVNFEGAEQLLRRARIAADQKESLSGAVIDCNASGASEILDTIREFNTIARNIRNEFPINQIQEAFILFRADNTVDVDARFQAEGCVLHRYFDLNEKTKPLLYALADKSKNQALDPFSKNGREGIEEIILLLRRDGLLKTALEPND